MSLRLRVLKEERRLELWEGEACLGAWPCRLGRAPLGPKRREGDGRTPEGRFYVCTRNAASRFHRFLGLSYPRPEDAEGRAEYTAIAEAHARGLRPPWDTPLGGQIGVHGAPNGQAMPEGDWTEGCIALDDDVMDLLWERCALGTPVEIA
jgi:murein L,D-transpeptidase YafK